MLNNGYEYKKRANIFFVIIYLVLGLYFINFKFVFVKIPEAISKFNDWIVFVGGIFIIIGAINYFRVKRNRYTY